jgi:hypothetical protein
MAYFKWAYDLSGNKTPQILELPIATGTAIEFGEIVKFTPGTGVVAIGDADQDDPYLGVAMEEHDGSTAGRQSGTLIKVSVSPTAVYRLTPRDAITASSGSTTTFVDSSLLPANNDYFNGGKIKLVAVASDSTLNGKIVSISDYTGSGGTLTLGETLSGAIASGDTAYLCPGPYAITAYGWDLNSDGTDINWESSGGEAIQIVDVDPDTFTVYVKLRLHQFGDDAAAK